MAVAGAALVPAAAEAGNSTVKINQYTGSNWIGQVKSSKSSCENGRKVTIYRVEDGKDTKIGKDKTQSGKGDTEGVFFVTHQAAPAGKYYAKVEPKSDCDGDKSKVFEIEVSVAGLR